LAGSSDPFEAGPFSWARDPLPIAPGPARRAGRRALATALVAWAPLAVLSALEGLALGPSAHESFLLDCAAYGRYLVAAPILAYASAPVLPRLRHVVRHFADARLVREVDLPRYRALVDSTRRLVAARWTDAVLIAVAVVVSLARSPFLYPSTIATWVMPAHGGTIGRQSLAGWWRLVVSQPLFMTLLLTWLWRIALWTRFSYGVSRLDLRLIATHPDLLGGLRFTLIAARGFAVLAFALGAIAASSVAEGVLVDGLPLSTFQFAIGTHVLVVELLFAGPALVWLGPLSRLHAAGTLHYGRLASDLGRAFQQRWLVHGRRAGADALQAPDFSATADLFSVAANVRAMNLLVLDLRTVAALGISTLLPYVPVVLAVMPINEILRFALKAVA
jgi:hypothetical protein